MPEVTMVKVRSRRDIVNYIKNKKSTCAKPVFVVKTSTPEVDEMKVRETIRELKLFKSQNDYDIITGSNIGIKHQMKYKGYSNTPKDPNYTLTIRCICHKCDRMISETVENVSPNKIRILAGDPDITPHNFVILDEEEKCITC